MGRSGLFILIVIVLLAIAAYFWFSQKGAQNETMNAPATTEQPAEPATGAPGGENMAAPETGSENMATPAPETAPAPEPAPDNTATPPAPQL